MTYSPYDAFRALLFAPPSPTNPKSGLQNEPPARAVSPPQPENQPLKEARCSNEFIEHLEHLRETKDLFDHLAHLDHLAQPPPHEKNSRKTKRNLFCATPLRSRDLIRLVRFFRTSLQATRPRPSRCTGIFKMPPAGGLMAHRALMAHVFFPRFHPYALEYPSAGGLSLFSLTLCILFHGGQAHLTALISSSSSRKHRSPLKPKASLMLRFKPAS